MSTHPISIRPFVALQESRPVHGLAQLTLIALICLSVTLPVITISSSLPWFKIEQLALPAIFLAYLWMVLAGFVVPIQPNMLFAVGAVYAVCVSLSLVYGSVLLGHDLVLSDFYEIPKALLPVAFFTLGLEARLSERNIRRLLSWFSAALVLVCLYAWAQWMDLGISHFLAPFYSGGAHDEGALSHYRRVYSTMGNPNILGQLMTWGLTAFALALWFEVGNRFRNLALAAACLITMVMTGSRYGIIDTAIAMLLISWLAWKSRRRRSFAFLALLVILPATAWTVFGIAGTNRATLDRLETLRNPLTTDSLRGRVDELWQDAADRFLESPVLGHGPAKSIFAGIITDSEYLDVLKEFGLVGFMVYLLYFLVPLRSLWNALRYSVWSALDVQPQWTGRLWLIRTAFVMGVIALAMNIGMSTFYSQPLQGFLWMWLGAGVGAARDFESTTRFQKPSEPNV